MTLMETDSRLRNGHTDNFHIAFTNLNLNTHNDEKTAQTPSHSKQAKQYPFLAPDTIVYKEIKNDAANVKSSKVKYGELILLGYNGSLHEGDKGRKRSKFEMVARPEGSANGVSFRARRMYTPEADDSGQNNCDGHVGRVREALEDVHTYAVAYTFNDLNNNKDNKINSNIKGNKVNNKVNNEEASSVVVVLHEYGLDPDLDMYQVGRSPEKPIDFVVLDTLRPSPTGQHSAPPLSHCPGQHNGNPNQHHSSHRHHHNHHSHQNQGRHAAPPLTTTPQGSASKDRTNGAREQCSAPTPPVKSTTAHATAAILTESTISRFACRFTVQRSPAYTVRVYAAGFDTSNNIFLGPKAVKWRQGDDLYDGLTTNGVLIAHPDPAPPVSADDVTADCPLPSQPHRIPHPPSKWYEVSVEGRLYTLRLPQSMNTCGILVEGEDNALQDWTLIDICGATLLYRSAKSLECLPNAKTVESYVEQVNSLKPQCPVRLSTLVVPKRLNNVPSTTGCSTTATTNGLDNRAYVYLKCGHVQGLHQWGKEGSHNRKCPICQKIGPFAPLYPGLESAFYVEDGPLTHAFDPCGHMTNQSTARYWSSITIPSAEFKRICPFCATELAEPGYVKLHFQSEN